MKSLEKILLTEKTKHLFISLKTFNMLKKFFLVTFLIKSSLLSLVIELIVFSLSIFKTTEL